MHPILPPEFFSIAELQTLSGRKQRIRNGFSPEDAISFPKWSKRGLTQ